MSSPQNRDRRIHELEAEIRRHRDLYYNKQPEISDAEFDRLVEELETLSPRSPVLAEVGAPVDMQKAGLPTKRHRIPMGSLEKIPEERLEAWAEKAGPLFLVQEKYDGISLEIEYEKGRMGDAITRGDGYVGEVVTHNAVYFKNVRRRLKVPFTGSVRGEVILRKSQFEKHFAHIGFANPRNTVSGTVRKKHGDRSHNRHFELFFYDVVSNEKEFETEHEKMLFVRDELRLDIAISFFDHDLEGVRRIYQEYRGGEGDPGKRFELDYEIDGLVVRADSIAKQRELGVVANRPRFATAYKFPSEGQVTTLRAVDWSLGIGSRVTPVARLEPVKIGGVTVSNATLHNVDYIESLGVRIGDRVLVERAGDVIPQVMRVTESQGGKVPAPPEDCPSCGEELDQEGKFLRCSNPECPGKSYGDVYKYIQEMDIDSLGEKWIRILLAQGLVQDPADLYRLQVDDLVPLERMGETLAAKILRNIDGSRDPPLDRFLAALNIPGFSRQRAQMLIESGVTDLDALLSRSQSEIAQVKGFGEILARSVVKGLAARKIRIERLLAAGVSPRAPEAASVGGGSLDGKTFCFSGAVQKTDDRGKRYTRAEMQKLVVEHGGRALTDVTSNLDYLVLADPQSTSSKAKKARKLGVTIVSEEEFFEMLSPTGGR